SAFVLVLLCLLIFLVWRRGPAGSNQLQELNYYKTENQEFRIELARCTERIQHLEKVNQDLKGELESVRAKYLAAMKDLERSHSFYQAQQERLEQQKYDLQRSHEELSRDFELIANRILEEKTKKFTEQNSINLGLLLDPLKENIRQF